MINNHKLLALNHIKKAEKLGLSRLELLNRLKTIVEKQHTPFMHSTNLIECISRDLGDTRKWILFYETLKELGTQIQTILISNEVLTDLHGEKQKSSLVRLFQTIIDKKSFAQVQVKNSLNALWLDVHKDRLKRLKQQHSEFKKYINELQDIIEQKWWTTNSIVKVTKVIIGMYLYLLYDMFESHIITDDYEWIDKGLVLDALSNHFELACAFWSFYIVDDIIDEDLVISWDEKQCILQMIYKGIIWNNIDTKTIPSHYSVATFLAKQFVILQYHYPFEQYQRLRQDLLLFFQAQNKDISVDKGDIKKIKLYNILKSYLTRVCVRQFANSKPLLDSEKNWYIIEWAFNQAWNDFRTFHTDKTPSLFNSHEPKSGYHHYLKYLYLHYQYIIQCVPQEHRWHSSQSIAEQIIMFHYFEHIRSFLTASPDKSLADLKVFMNEQELDILTQWYRLYCDLYPPQQNQYKIIETYILGNILHDKQGVQKINESTFPSQV